MAKLDGCVTVKDGLETSVQEELWLAGRLMRVVLADPWMSIWIFVGTNELYLPDVGPWWEINGCFRGAENGSQFAEIAGHNLL